MMTALTGAGILIGTLTTAGIRAVYLFSRDAGRRGRALAAAHPPPPLTPRTWCARTN